MKKKSCMLLLALTLVSSLFLSSCIGSFGLTNKLLTWNKSIDSKFVNELVFIAFHIVPVYELSWLADILVINSIEFWSGENPVDDMAQTQKIETANGTYWVQSGSNGYTVSKEGKINTVDFVFNETENSWNIEYSGEVYPLLKYTEEDKVVMFLPDGNAMLIPLNKDGVSAFEKVANHSAYFASR